MESTCVSINIGPPINDQVMCQLSDSDNTRHPEDLKPQEGFMYRGTEVRNSNPGHGSSMLLFALCCCIKGRLPKDDKSRWRGGGVELRTPGPPGPSPKSATALVND